MSESDTMFNERNRRCAAVQLMLSTDQSYENMTIASTLKMQTWFQVRATWCHPTSWKSTPKCTWMCWRVWWSPGAIRWPVVNPVCGSRTRRRLTSPKRPRLGFRRCITSLYPSLTAPTPPPIWSSCLVIRREHHQHDLPQLQSQPDRCHPPSICGAPAGACGKGMLPVRDPYRGGDWGWRRLHWIDVSSTTQSSYLNWFFQ